MWHRQHEVQQGSADFFLNLKLLLIHLESEIQEFTYRMLSFIARAFFFLALIVSKVISTPDSRGAKNFYDMQPSPSFVSLGVKGYQQTFDYSCGPSSVMSLLHWYGVLSDEDMNRDTEKRLIEGMHCNASFGTKSQDMAAWLNVNGFVAQARVNGTIKQLIGHLKAGVPVLVEWLDWGGHWVVLTGFFESSDDRESTVFFADPAAHWFSIDNPSGISSFSATRFEDMVSHERTCFIWE
jgi:predicted double-glycine peptidase